MLTATDSKKAKELASRQCDLRTEELLKEHQQTVFVRTDRMFVRLMIFQFVCGIIMALTVSPQTWAGSTSSIHIHVWTALFLGGAIACLPISLVIAHPGKSINRYVIAICQMLTSALWIHLSGGRIETHFHIFVSLAFLASYRDWRVLVPATIVVVLDHIGRGFFWPQSVYGVLSAPLWRSFEHAAWVLFEDAFLVVSIRQGVHEMRELARHRAKLETSNAFVEAEVQERTAELKQANRNLEAEVLERQLAEIETRDRQLQLQSILESAGEGIVTTDTRGMVATFNLAAGEMFGYQAKEVVGKNITMLIPVAPHEQHDLHLASHLLTGQNENVGTKREAEGKRKNGELFPIELNVSKVKADGTHLFTTIIRDLTEQKKLHCELAQAQKLESVGQLAAGIAHEINTPTQYVGDNTRFLKEAFEDMGGVLDKFDKLLQAAKEGAVDERLITEIEAALEEADVAYLTEEIPQAIDQSLDGIERVAKIVRAMKQFSHPGSEDKNLVDLAEAIETTITVANNEWKYVAEMVTEFDPKLPQISCLPGELNQVFLNLIVNAAHAIDDARGKDISQKGTITVGTCRDGEWAEVFIRDTGTGMPESVRARIFDPFFTTKEVGKGTGQGLAIAHSVVVDKHGGTIDCETEQGKGTTFIIRLPIAEQRVAQEADNG